jgi:hypothetical protein
MFVETPEDGQCPSRGMDNVGAAASPRSLNPLNEQRIDGKWTRILGKLKAQR